MPLKYGNINPLVVFGMRRLAHKPKHFEPIYFDARVDDKVITDWVWENLEGRFFYGDYLALAQNGASTMQKVIAFEESSEASYFCLMQSTINGNHKILA